MLASSKSITVVVVCLCVALVVGYLVGRKGWAERTITPVANESRAQHGSTKLQERSLLKWQELLEPNLEHRKDIVKGLIGIAQDQTRDGEQRIFAVMLLREANSQGAIEFLMRNINMYVEKSYFLYDDDRQKQRPCFYALQKMGWQVIPHALESVEGQRTSQELQLLAQLFPHICGRRVALVILEEHMNGLAGDPVKAQAIANIKQIISDISGETEPAK